MAKKHKTAGKPGLRNQSRRLHDSMAWLLRGFTLFDPRKRYPEFYLSPQQSYVLTVVKSEGKISPGEVAKKLRLEKSHLTKIVNSLVKFGAIDKLSDDRDRRRMVLSLSGKGEKIFRELDQASIESYMKLMEKVPEGEREKVIHSIEVLLRAMQKLRKE
ncbi:MarR family transcriptional regulator [bacterium]|nr:MarR family transcriptional regulator [bacterium]